MATSYPGAIDSFDTHVDNVDDVMAADVNDLNDAVVATQTALGTDSLIKTTWTPTVTQSGAVAVTVSYAYYRRVGDMLFLQAYLTVTGSGTAGNNIVIGGLPVNPQSEVANLSAYGVGAVIDTGTANYYGFVTTQAAGTLHFRDSNTRGVIGTSPSFALANTDLIYFTATYFVA